MWSRIRRQRGRRCDWGLWRWLNLLDTHITRANMWRWQFVLVRTIGSLDSLTYWQRSRRTQPDLVTNNQPREHAWLGGKQPREQSLTGWQANNQVNRVWLGDKQTATRTEPDWMTSKQPREQSLTWRQTATRTESDLVTNKQPREHSLTWWQTNSHENTPHLVTNNQEEERRNALIEREQKVTENVTLQPFHVSVRNTKINPFNLMPVSVYQKRPILPHLLFPSLTRKLYPVR